jgi:Flp pilus assembly protein TadG
MQLANRLKQWLLHPREHRGAARYASPCVAAYYWNGSAPLAHEIKDISSTGVYMYTTSRWYPGTILTLTLQAKLGPDADGPVDSVSVHSKVVRQGKDGVGLRFACMNSHERKNLSQFLKNTVTNPKGSKGLRKVIPTEGQALIEYALVLPLLFLLIVNMVNFGGFFYGWITVANASRAAAQYAVLGGASVGAPEQPTASLIDGLISQDVFSLLNGSKPTVNVCIYTGATVKPAPYKEGTCSDGSSDPEPTLYASAVVDVTYTYNPLIPLFSFPKLGIRATLPSSTIHRRTYMRMIQ